MPKTSLTALLLVVFALHAIPGAEVVPSTVSATNSLNETDRPLHILVTCLPFYGHFLPVKAIAEALVERGHRVTVLIENCAWAASPVPLRCIPMRKSATFPASLFRSLSQLPSASESWPVLVSELAKHHEEEFVPFLEAAEKVHAEDPIHAVLTDVSTMVGLGVAHKLDLPYASVYPLVLRLPIDVQSWLPLIGSGDPRWLTFPKRWFTFAINFLLPLFAMPSMVWRANAVRAANGVRPFRSLGEVMGMESLVFTPTIWGYDIPQPVCPSIVPVGILAPKLDAQEMESELGDFLQSEACVGGAVYVNFGTLSWQSDRAVATIQAAFLGPLSSLCCVWKIIEPERQAAVLAAVGDERSRFFIRSRFNSPLAIMKHWRVGTFVTHCGDTSLGEAVTAGIPLVGIPFFADQEDVCQRVNESGIGIYVGHKHRFTSSALASAILGVMQNRSFRLREEALFPPVQSTFLVNLNRTAAMASRFGGQERAARLIESQLRSGILQPPSAGPGPFVCAEVAVASPFTINGYWSCLLWIGLWAVLARWLFRRVGCLLRRVLIRV